MEKKRRKVTECDEAEYEENIVRETECDEEHRLNDRLYLQAALKAGDMSALADGQPGAAITFWDSNGRILGSAAICPACTRKIAFDLFEGFCKECWPNVRPLAGVLSIRID
jgi:hypothetical protein